MLVTDHLTIYGHKQKGYPAVAAVWLHGAAGL